MSTDNIICILCNDVERWKVVSSNLPENIKNYKVVVVNDTRLGDKSEELKQVYDAEVIRGNDMIDDFLISAVNHENVKRYALVIKHLIPYYIFRHYTCSKLLVLDDDIIITSKIDDIFAIENNAALNGGLLVTPTTNLLGTYCEAVAMAALSFEMSFTRKTRRINGGQILYNINCLDMNAYVDALVNYVANDVMTNILNKQRNWNTYCLDELFMTALFNKYGFVNMTKYAFLYTKKYEDVNLEKIKWQIDHKALVHIITRINKMQIFYDLIENNYLKGTK